jgi:vancomycin permeability regulator SanA
VTAKATGTTRSGAPGDDQDLPRARRSVLRRVLRRTVRYSLAAIVATVVAFGPTTIWMAVSSARHLYTVDTAPETPVVIVFGAPLEPGGTTPTPFLAGRLEVAARLVSAGKAKAVLVSGDGHDTSGDEVAAMTSYLVAHGVPARRIVGDPYGLDSYDTCMRARVVYGVRRALLVSQSYHLPRAVSLCRRLGIDANGVGAQCDGCANWALSTNTLREFPAGWKAAYDALSGRPPAVSSQHDEALTHALED